MGIIGIDSSGLINDPPIYTVAVRLKNVQKHRILHLSKETHDAYKKEICKNEKDSHDWILKLSSALMYKTAEFLIKPGDSIQIDMDFTGSRKEKVKKYLKKLFYEFHRGSQLQNPEIQFIPCMYSEHVKEADKKSKLARKRRIDFIECTNLWDCLLILK